MLRIAMNEPIMAARTAIQVAVPARFGSTAARSDLPPDSSGVEAERMRFDMAWCSGRSVRLLGCGCRFANASLRLRLDGRDHRHARTQFDRRRIIAVQRDLDRYALHHLGEVAGGVVRRQQREFLT